MGNKTHSPTGPAGAPKYNLWGVDNVEDAKREIKEIKGSLFNGREISWFTLKGLRFLEYVFNPDYRSFIKEEFNAYWAKIDNKIDHLTQIASTAILHSLQETEAPIAQIPPAALDSATPERPKNEDLIDSTSLQEASTIAPALDSPQKLETPNIQTQTTAPNNAIPETTPKNDSLSESIEIATTQIKETPSNALLTPITIKLKNTKLNLARLTNIKNEFDSIVERDPEIKTDPLFKKIKAELESSITEAERSFLDGRLRGEFTTGGKMNKDLVNEAIAGVRKDFNGTIGEYRIKVISAIVTKLLDAAKDNSAGLGSLNKMLSDLKVRIPDEILNVGDEEEDMDLLDPKSETLVEGQTLLGKINELLQKIETTESEAKAKEAPAKEAAAKQAAAKEAEALEILKRSEEARSAISGIRKRMKAPNLDLEKIKIIKTDFDRIVESNPEIKTDPDFEDTQIWIDRSIASTERIRRENKSEER